MDNASSAATWAAYSAGNATFGDWVEARLHERLDQERSFSHDVLAEVIAGVANNLRDEFDRALAGLRAQRSLTVCGTYNPASEYRCLDTVALNGGSFTAKVDRPGPCPGSDWQMVACQGKKGQPGVDGRDGKAGRDAPRITEWLTNRENYTVTPIMSDGSRGPPLELHPLFARFFAETEGVPEKVEGTL
jgi:hypothetical protein